MPLSIEKTLFQYLSLVHPRDQKDGNIFLEYSVEWLICTGNLYGFTT